MGVLAGIEDATGFDLRRCESSSARPPERSSPPTLLPESGRAGRPRPGPRSSRARPQPVTTACRRCARRRPGGRVAGTRRGSVVRSARARDLGARGRRAPRDDAPPSPPSDDDARAICRRTSTATGARFDGRLRVVAVDRRNGQRVVFGSPGAPRASASPRRSPPPAACRGCSRRSTIGGREYVDGGVWSPTQPRRRARRPRHPCPVPEPDREPRRLTDHPLGPAPRRPDRRVARVDGPAPPGRRGSGGRAERRVRRDDGHRLHGRRAPRAGAGGGYRQGLRWRRRTRGPPGREPAAGGIDAAPLATSEWAALPLRRPCGDDDFARKRRRNDRNAWKRRRDDQNAWKRRRIQALSCVRAKYPPKRTKALRLPVVVVRFGRFTRRFRANRRSHLQREAVRPRLFVAPQGRSPADASDKGH